MPKAPEKTNVMRLLEQARVPYTPHFYTPSGVPNGMEAADLLGFDPARVFKTLVTAGKNGAHFVFVVPVCRELHLKRAALAVHEKSVEMIPQRELLPLTGYIHGGCSPIGMKKRFITVIDASARAFSTVLCSAGRIGAQVELAPDSIAHFVPLSFADVADDA